MIEAIGSISEASEAFGITQMQGVDQTGGAGKIDAGDGADSDGFGDMVAGAIDALNTSQNQADMLSQQAATGELESVTDFMVASTEAQLMTQLATQIRNRAVDAFNDIMRMPV
jgi:flagellar hook-basal body complex protein FliE